MQPQFSDIVRAHLPAAYNLARWLVRNPSLAEDVVQDAMLRALKYFPSFRGENARAWLLQIVRNVAYATTQQAPRMTTFADFHSVEMAEQTLLNFPDAAADPEAVLAKSQDAGYLDELLSRLPIELRECIVLRELEELSYREIADITATPMGTVMSRLWRARQLLMQAARREP
jgi:RNA polymerase sigma-70 factor (ECF subfamily)